MGDPTWCPECGVEWDPTRERCWSCLHEPRPMAMGAEYGVKAWCSEMWGGFGTPTGECPARGGPHECVEPRPLHRHDEEYHECVCGATLRCRDRFRDRIRNARRREPIPPAWEAATHVSVESVKPVS